MWQPWVALYRSSRRSRCARREIDLTLSLAYSGVGQICHTLADALQTRHFASYLEATYRARHCSPATVLGFR
jgi:hypothetical protein